MGVKRHPADARASWTKSRALNGRRVYGPSRSKEEGTEFNQTGAREGKPPLTDTKPGGCQQTYFREAQDRPTRAERNMAKAVK